MSGGLAHGAELTAHCSHVGAGAFAGGVGVGDVLPVDVGHEVGRAGPGATVTEAGRVPDKQHDSGTKRQRGAGELATPGLS